MSFFLNYGLSFKLNWRYFFLSGFSFTYTEEWQDSRGIEEKLNWRFFFSVTVFFYRYWRFTGQQEKGFTRSRTFRNLLATLSLRWLPRNFNRTACNYQTANQWDLPSCCITIWLINEAMLLSVYLLDDLILWFCCSNLTRKTGGFKLANQVTK